MACSHNMDNGNYRNQFSARDQTLDLSSPKIMGVLNATPDSFSDGGEYNSLDTALQRIEQMIAEGADIIDVGGESTRPGSEPVSAKEEKSRVIPILERAITRFPGTLFSVDTTKYTVAEEALAAGVHLVNDVSGLTAEPRFADLCMESGAGLILMHAQGDPKTMQENPTYNDVVEDIYRFFKQQLKKVTDMPNVILDPGIGFGKTQAHNIRLIRELDAFSELGYPLLVGASRKSVIGHILGGRPVDDRLIGTIAVHYHAMLNGASIIRVHDVKEANDSILVYNTLARN